MVVDAGKAVGGFGAYGAVLAEVGNAAQTVASAECLSCCRVGLGWSPAAVHGELGLIAGGWEGLG